ncbi:MAG: peptide-N-glycosidase F-related protein [bacterium]
MGRLLLWTLGLGALALAACDDGGGGGGGAGGAGGAGGVGGGGVGGGGDVGAPDMGGGADAAPQVDAGELDAALPDAAPPDMGPPRPPDICDELALPRRPFAEGTGVQFGDIAGDFTVQTLDGPWSFREHFTGCEAYVFLLYIPDLRQNPQGAWVGTELWNTDVEALVRKTPANTHYFFVSLEEDATARERRMRAMEGRLARAAPDGLADRFHLVTDRVTEIDGSVGAFVRDYLDYLFDPASQVDLGDRGRAQPPLPFAFAIDRLQRWDEGGSLNEVVGRPMLWDMASYFGPFYNHIASVYDQVAAEDATTITLPMVEGRVSARIFTPIVELPDAAAMAEVDEMTFDVSVTCPARNVFGCSEWDRIASIALCMDETCEARQEVARWITPYWRRGERRWLLEASPMLGLLREGGARMFRVEMGPEWERATERDVRVTLRLRSQGGRRAEGTQFAFGGGSFGAEYNMRAPFRFTPPADASRVEVVLLLSGHGQTANDNCAEWCDRHAFTLNDQPLSVVRHLGEVGSLRGCAEQASAGVPPGQYGNWAPERAYWCPGMPVQPIRLDITGRSCRVRRTCSPTRARSGRTPRRGVATSP